LLQLLDQFLVTLRSQRHVVLARCLRLLLEAVQYVDRRLEFRDVDHPESACRFPHSDFPDSAADTRHRLPIKRVATALNQVQLKPGLAPGIIWKLPQVRQRASPKLDRFADSQYATTYNILYNSASAVLLLSV